MSIFSYKYPSNPVQPNFPRCPARPDLFSFMLTSEPSSQYSVPVFIIIKVTGCSVILDSVLCLHLYLIVWESLCFWTCAAQSRTGRLQRQIKQETWRLCSGVINNAQTHSSTLLSKVLYSDFWFNWILYSKSNLARPGQKGSKMIVLNARDKKQMSGEGWYWLGWSPRPEDIDNYCCRWSPAEHNHTI